MFKAGAQVPVTPVNEVVGSGAKTSPEQIGAIGSNVDVKIGFTTIVMVAGNPH